MNDRSWSCAEIATLLGLSARRGRRADRDAVDPGSPAEREPAAPPDPREERRDAAPRRGLSQ